MLPTKRVLLGLFPAVIIAISIRMNYRKIAAQESR